MELRAAQLLMLTGETFNAHRAHAVGLLSECVVPEGIDSVVHRHIEALLLAAAGAIGGVKPLVNMDREPKFGADLQAMLPAAGTAGVLR